ncbi:cytochrome b561 and DOMON domain-containing protein At3g07570-like [Neltuma alba]|uniref:cytochrome b561 and DOMON domain-containing protein At3g07570-like n=1 Tax=Neltuma alba TaxID=207710 RepID=UPI0010A2C841|nr:cytochrome b561 and DOMON domain-containing protein At3g07570-like [Prosopis alba]
MVPHRTGEQEGTEEGMKHFLLLYFVFFIVFCSSSTLVTSQLDSCSQNVDPQRIDFDTTSLRCVAVWPDHNFILRYAQVSPNLWSFVLSFPININSYGAIGFSDDGRMEGSSAIVGWDMPAGGGIDGVKQYYLGGMTQAEVVADKGNLLYANASIVSTPTSIVYVAFQLQTNQPSSLLLFALGPQNFYPTGTQFLLLQHIDMISIDIDYASGLSNFIATRKRIKSEASKWFAGYGASLGFLLLVVIILEIRMLIKPKAQIA